LRATLKTQTTFDAYNDAAKNNNDPFCKRFFRNVPCNVDDTWNVAIIGPVVHYTMGGVSTDEHSRVLRPDKTPIPGLCVGVGVAVGA
jgi:succinate dehydrogenase/fumarate reductase flavoprotein subunit